MCMAENSLCAKWHTLKDKSLSLSCTTLFRCLPRGNYYCLVYASRDILCTHTVMRTHMHILSAPLPHGNGNIL